MKFPVAFCARQQGQRGAGAHGKAGDPSFERSPLAVHVHVELDALSDAQVGELGFLEIGVDPDFGQRTDGHQRLAGLDVVARIDVAAGDDAVDLGEDIAIAQVQVGLRQVALGLMQFAMRPVE